MHFVYIRAVIPLKNYKFKLLHLFLARLTNKAEIHAIFLYKCILCQTLLLKVYIFEYCISFAVGTSHVK